MVDCSIWRTLSGETDILARHNGLPYDTDVSITWYCAKFQREFTRRSHQEDLLDPLQSRIQRILVIEIDDDGLDFVSVLLLKLFALSGIAHTSFEMNAFVRELFRDVRSNGSSCAEYKDGSHVVKY